MIKLIKSFPMRCVIWSFFEKCYNNKRRYDSIDEETVFPRGEVIYTGGHAVHTWARTKVPWVRAPPSCIIQGDFPYPYTCSRRESRCLHACQDWSGESNLSGKAGDCPGVMNAPCVCVCVWARTRTHTWHITWERNTKGLTELWVQDPLVLGSGIMSSDGQGFRNLVPG